MMMVILINIRLHTKPEKEAGRWEFDLLNSFLVEEQTFNIGYFSGWKKRFFGEKMLRCCIVELFLFKFD